MNPTITFAELCAGIKSLTLPSTVLLAIGQGNPARVVNQATGLLLASEKANMLVTCAHVYDKFLELKAEDPTTRLAMSGAEGKDFIDISPATVLGLSLGKNGDPDLATLSIPQPDAVHVGKWYMDYGKVVVRRPQVGMMGYLIGYPGQLIVISEGSASKPLMEFARPVVSVSERHFVLHDEAGDVVQNYIGTVPEVTKLGGVSGCAVWIYDKKTNPPGFFLGGFAYQASGVDTVLVAHADFINADGSIR
jgi:hypothetical protein